MYAADPGSAITRLAAPGCLSASITMLNWLCCAMRKPARENTPATFNNNSVIS